MVGCRGLLVAYSRGKALVDAMNFFGFIPYRSNKINVLVCQNLFSYRESLHILHRSST